MGAPPSGILPHIVEGILVCPQYIASSTHGRGYNERLHQVQYDRADIRTQVRHIEILGQRLVRVIHLQDIFVVSYGLQSLVHLTAGLAHPLQGLA